LPSSAQFKRDVGGKLGLKSGLKKSSGWGTSFKAGRGLNPDALAYGFKPLLC
jgi:hypothetical protein